jgi:hypothetical protein
MRSNGAQQQPGGPDRRQQARPWPPAWSRHHQGRHQEAGQEEEGGELRGEREPHRGPQGQASPHAWGAQERHAQAHRGQVGARVRHVHRGQAPVGGQVRIQPRQDGRDEGGPHSEGRPRHHEDAGQQAEQPQDGGKARREPRGPGVRWRQRRRRLLGHHVRQEDRRLRVQALGAVALDHPRGQESLAPAQVEGLVVRPSLVPGGPQGVGHGEEDGAHGQQPEAEGRRRRGQGRPSTQRMGSGIGGFYGRFDSTRRICHRQRAAGRKPTMPVRKPPGVGSWPGWRRPTGRDRRGRPPSRGMPQAAAIFSFDSTKCLGVPCWKSDERARLWSAKGTNQATVS